MIVARTRSVALQNAAFALTASLLAAVGCARPEPAVEPPEHPNVLVVLVDTLRADRLSLYGYERETSPNLDRFARRRGVVFENAWANTGCTFPSVNSILTGRWPQIFVNSFQKLGLVIPADFPTLGERLRELGYATAAVSASQVVRATPSKVNRQGGFDRGFDRFDESCLELDAGCVNGRAFAALDELPEPFLLYLHYLDPHEPYAPPAGTPHRWAGASAEGVKKWARQGWSWRIGRRIFKNELKYHFGAAEVRHLSDLYDEEVRYFDQRFGELIAELERRDLLSRTVVVFVADHGEELYENGGFGHCLGPLWETIVATPFVLAVPGVDPGVRSTRVSNIDLMPTLLDLVGVPEPENGLDGRSLRKLLERGESSPDRRISFAAQGPWRVARDSQLKVRCDVVSKQVVFLQPGTVERPAPADAAGRRELLEALRAWLQETRAGNGSESVRQGEALEAELRALGYL